MVGIRDGFGAIQDELKRTVAQTTDARRELQEIRAREEYDAIDNERNRRERLVAAISETPEGGSLSEGQIAGLNRMKGIEGNGVQNGQIMSAGYNPKTGGWRFAVAQDDGNGNIRTRQHEIPRHELYGMMSNRPNMFSEEQVMRFGSQMQTADPTYTTSRLDEIRKTHALKEDNLKKRYDDAWRRMADISPSFGRGYRGAQAKPERYRISLEEVKDARERIAEYDERIAQLNIEGAKDASGNGADAVTTEKEIKKLESQKAMCQGIVSMYYQQYGAMAGMSGGSEKTGAGSPAVGGGASDAYDAKSAAEILKERNAKNKGASAAVGQVAGNTEGYGLRNDGKTYKGTGWLGELKTSDGGVATEYTMQSDAVKDANGNRIDFPTLVPTLTQKEIDLMVNDVIPNKKPVPDAIAQKAVDFAKMRIANGMSVFANDGAKPAGGGRAREAGKKPAGAAAGAGRLKEGEKQVDKKVDPKDMTEEEALVAIYGKDFPRDAREPYELYVKRLRKIKDEGTVADKTVDFLKFMKKNMSNNNHHLGHG